MTMCVHSVEVQQEGRGTLPQCFCLRSSFLLFSPWPGGYQRKGFSMTELVFLMGKRALFVIHA